MPLHIPFETIDWNEIPMTEHKGERGTAWWKTIQLGSVRIRMVEYSPGYSADYWCQKGHIIFCIEGRMITELEDGRSFVLKQGMSYHVSDNASSHKSTTATGAKLFIIDGDFLQ